MPTCQVFQLSSSRHANNHCYTTICVLGPTIKVFLAKTGASLVFVSLKNHNGDYILDCCLYNGSIQFP